MFRIIGGSWKLEEAWDTYRRYLLHTWKTNEFHDPHNSVSRFLYTLGDLYVLELPGCARATSTITPRRLCLPAAAPPMITSEPHHHVTSHED